MPKQVPVFYKDKKQFMEEVRSKTLPELISFVEQLYDHMAKTEKQLDEVRSEI